MKKLLGLLAVFLMFNSCDDGELTVENVDFGDAIIQSCGTNGILYKLNGNEVLILSIPQDLNPYPEVVGEKSYPITGTTQVRYRIYNGKVATDNVCATIQPGTPQVTEEWIAVGGLILINTTPVLSLPDETTAATKILRYNHYITFKNIVYAKPDGSTITFAENTPGSIFGDYTTTVTDLPFKFTAEDVNQCATNKMIYNVAEISTQESLVIQNIDPALLTETLGKKSGAIGKETNMVIYQYYNTSLPTNLSDYFCATTTPLLPLVTQKWTANVGDEATKTGMINVLTEDAGNGKVKHTITFQKVTFSDAVSGASFFYGNEILYGVLRP